MVSLVRSAEREIAKWHIAGPTDWRIGADDEVGASFGEGPKLGASAVYNFELRRVTNEKVGFDLKGGTISVGIGAGVKGEGLKEVFGKFVKILERASHLQAGPGLPGGGIGRLHHGWIGSKTLGRKEFDKSNWIFVCGDFNSATIGGEIGMIFLLSRPFSSLRAEAISIVASTSLFTNIAINTIAWGALGGMSFGFGVEAGISVREFLMFVTKETTA